MKLYKRKIFNEIEPFLGDETVIVLHGARQVGKTHILYFIEKYLKEKGKKVFYYDLEYPELLEEFNKGVNSFVLNLQNKGYKEGEEIYALIDEIQYLDNPSSFLKILADHYKNIRLIVSGSSTFDIKSKFKDSLAGRITPFEIFPLSFEEFLFFKNSEYKLSKDLSLSTFRRIGEYYKEFIKFGGYPKVVLKKEEEKKKSYLVRLVDTYIRKDVRDLADVTDIKKFNNMLKILASQSGKLLDMPSLSRETNISLPTLTKYLSILEETYVVKLVSPYSKSPSVEISKNPKVFMYDSGLQSILWLNNFQETVIGSVFETNIFSEMVKKYGRENIHFWRTKQKQEIDFILEKENGQIIPMEVKINFGAFSKKNINSFLRKYKVSDWKVVGLEGDKIPGKGIYPWEI